MFTLALAVAIATAPAPPVLTNDPASCPASAPWAVPSGSEVAAYVCQAADFGETTPDPSHVKPPVTRVPVRHPLHHAKPKHHAPAKHHPAPKHHHAPKGHPHR